MSGNTVAQDERLVNGLTTDDRIRSGNGSPTVMTDNGGRAPTLADVAAHANVSRQTISRVINNKGEVSEETRQRVLTAIREIGYHPNSLARSLVTRKTYVIGLSLPNIDHPFFPQIARGIEDAANENGYSVFLCNAAGKPEREIKAIERLRGHRVDGVISLNSQLTDEAVERAVSGSFPVILVHRELPNLRGTVIWTGYETGARQATEHLISTGRRRILYLGLPHESSVDADKLSGYRAALEQEGIAFDPMLVARIPSKHGMTFQGLAQGGYDAMAGVIEQGLEIDAVFAANDLPAVGVLQYATAHQIRIPEDIAVVGFGKSNASGFVTPSLSTVSMPLYEMGVTAFHTLLDRMKGLQDESRQVEIAPELVIRESSMIKGRPPAPEEP